MHKSQTFFYLLLSFLLGIFFTSFVFVSKNIWLVGLIVGVVVIISFWRRKWKFVLYGFLILVFIFGGIRFQSFDSSNSILKIFVERSSDVIFRGYIGSEVDKRGNRQQLTLRVKEVQVVGKIIDINEKILITTERFPEYFYGDTLEIKGDIKFPENFDDFDYKTYLAKDGIFTVSSFPEVEKVKLNLKFKDRLKVGVFKKIFSVKDSFQKSVQRSVSEPQAAFINGILLGTRESIPQDLKDDFAKTGITHVLAISGYNITIIATIMSWIFLLFFKRKIAFWFSVLAIILFTILTGASASVIRAAIMGVLILLANNSGRLYDPKNALALAAAIMIWINPMSLRFDVGFQLSFLATIGILYLSPLIMPMLEKLPKLLSFRETFAMTTSAQLMVLPLVLYYFNSISIVALPTNLIILPFIPYAMFLGFLTGIAGLFSGFLGLIFGYFAWAITSFEILVTQFFASIPFVSFNISIPWYLLVIFYIFAYYLIRRGYQRAKNK